MLNVVHKSILIAPIIAILVGAISTSIASRAYADDAQTQGYNVAKFDFLHNRAYDNSCDPNNGDAFCAAYRAADIMRDGMQQICSMETRCNINE